MLRGFGFWFAATWTGVWGYITAGMLGTALDGGPGSEGAGYAAAVCAGLAGLGALACAWTRRRKPVEPSSLTYRRPDWTAIPPARVRPEKRYRLPRPGSVARTPVRQLSQAESALALVMHSLTEIVPADVAERTWRVATDAAAELRSVAARLEAVEAAAENAPPDLRPALLLGVTDLERRLTEGVHGYQSLLAAAGEVVVAGTPTPATELTEATETLAGLAAGLRELSPPDL